MSKFFRSLLFKTNLAAFRTAILTNNTNKICRILDIERDHICKELDSAGNTALLVAIKYASPLTVRVLLEQGAHPDQPNRLTFQTPLGFLASTIYEDDQMHESKIALEIATMLLDHGAYIDKPSPYTFTDENDKDYTIKETPLMTAVRTKNVAMATLFVERKANINYVEKQTEYRPIHFAITNGDATMFNLLESAGASCRSVIAGGDNTLLHWFCYNQANDEHMSLFKKLINKGCDVNAPNDIQRTPLMLAAKLDMINTCHTLLNASADVDKVDSQGYRAIDFARHGSDCFKLLQKYIQMNSQQTSVLNRVIWRKQILSPHRLSRQNIDSIHHLDINELQMKHSSVNTSDNENNSISIDSDREQDREEMDTRYKKMWEKLLQTKEKIRRNRDSSLQRPRDRSQQRSRDLSQQRPIERFQQRIRDSSQQRTNEIYKKDANITFQL